MSRFTMAFLMASASIFVSSANAQQTQSSVVVPVSLNLAAAQARLNAEVPDVLYSVDQGQNCGRVKLPWPLRGSVGIDCHVTGQALKNGPITVGGVGRQILVSAPVRAWVTARGRGEVGRHIRETAEAAVTLSIAATPTIDAEWNVGLAIDHSLHWDQRPTVRLLGLIEITFASLVEPKIHELIEAQKAKLPALIADLKVKEKMEKAWAELQKPMKLSDAPPAWLAFKPSGIGFSGISTEDNILKVRAVLSGETSVSLGAAPESAPVPLPQLSPDVPTDGNFNLNIPIRLPLAELEAVANQEVDKLGEIKAGDLHVLTLSDVKLRAVDGALAIEAYALLDNKGGWLDWLDVFHWFDVKGTVHLKARPIVDDEKRLLKLADLDFDTSTSSLPVDALVETLRLPLIRQLLEKLVSYDYGADADKATAEANKHLTRDLGEGFRLDGTLQKVGVVQPVIDPQAIALPLALQGTLQVAFGLN
ncbi:DUF4403 family protein [Aquibium carbonis]|uniref:DUF4403 family protein n=1 Tax=Aquibium carbonis TaxID=2495581 RepID=A0A3R9ZSL3_9HYPH|nr:DUF4403 family protein [Aquibium carbonis]RST86726.1 DUF4403 family protein [Aquibium carbonis]